MYLEYEEYLTMGGALDSSTFSRLAYKMEKLVDHVTFERVKYMEVVPEAVKMCIYELLNAEEIYEGSMKNIAENTAAGKPGLFSAFTTDGYQESYATGSGNSGEYIKTLRENTDTLQQNIVKNYLDTEYDDNGVRLTYRGVY